MTSWLSAGCWLAGATFALLAAIGLLRMPDLFTRMQAAAKASTIGLALLLIGTAIELGDAASIVRATCIGAFVMLTSPVSAHVVARAAYLTNVSLWSGTCVDELREDLEQQAGVSAKAQRPNLGLTMGLNSEPKR